MVWVYGFGGISEAFGFGDIRALGFWGLFWGLLGLQRLWGSWVWGGGSGGFRAFAPLRVFRF